MRDKNEKKNKVSCRTFALYFPLGPGASPLVSGADKFAENKGGSCQDESEASEYMDVF